MLGTQLFDSATPLIRSQIFAALGNKIVVRMEEEKCVISFSSVSVAILRPTFQYACVAKTS